MTLSAPELFDYIDYEFAAYLLANGESDGNLDKVRAALAMSYDVAWFPVKDLYGSNDNTQSRRAPSSARDSVESPFQTAPRPYIPPTDQDESGFEGLAPPVG